MEDKKIGKYTLSKKIGKGSFSKVYKATYEDKEYAIKIVKLDKLNEKIRKNFEYEVEILEKLKHNNIVKCYEILKGNNTLCIVLEYCELGDLSDYIKSNKINKEEGKKIFIEISKGMYYLNQNKIIHRDLKPQNIFVTKEKEIKIGDFGFATDITETGLLNTLCGSPLYMAPEVLMGQKYNYKADLWSLGVILYQLIENELPFMASNHIDLINTINKKTYVIKKSDSIEKDLIQHLLVVEPEKRSTYEFFFKHEFFNGIQFVENIDEEQYILEDEVDNYLLDYKLLCIEEIAILGDRLKNIESSVLYAKYLKIMSNFIPVIYNEPKQNLYKQKFTLYLTKLEFIIRTFDYNFYVRTAEEIIYNECLSLLRTSMIIGILDIDIAEMIITSLRLFDSLTLDEEKILSENDRKNITVLYNKASKILESI